jgi:hypothetical protein
MTMRLCSGMCAIRPFDALTNSHFSILYVGYIIMQIPSYVSPLVKSMCTSC